MGSYGRGAGREMVERIAARTARATTAPLVFKSGSLKSYDPTTGMVVVTDYSGETPQDLGPMQYFHEWAGDGYGDEIGLEKGMHIAMLCVDREGNDYIAFGGAFDSDHKTLGAKSGERYIVHKSGTYIKWSNDAQPGDGKGAFLSNGAALHESTTTGGHSHTLDDTTKRITTTSAGGHSITYDDEAKTLTVKSASGHTLTLNDATQQISIETKNGLKHVMDDAAGKIGIGDFPGNLDPTKAALVQEHLTAYDGDLKNKRFDDLSKFAAAMIAAGVPNAGAVLGELASLVDVTMPSGSEITLIK